MDKLQKKFITKNLVKLVACTKDLNLLAINLISADLLSNSTWTKLKRVNHDDESLTQEMYTECMKTPKYDSLIECLDDSNNEEAAKILKGFYPTATDSKEQNQQSSSDFTVSDSALFQIVDLFKEENLWETDKWAAIQSSILSPSALETITDESNFGIRVLKDLQEWKKFQNERATFNKLHAIVNGVNPKAAGILLTAKSSIMNS